MQNADCMEKYTMKKLMICIVSVGVLLFASCESAYYAMYGANEALQAISDEFDQIYSSDE